MSHVEEELATQPSCWRRAPEVAAAHAGALPQRGERVAVIGCGTSLYMAQAYASRREAAGEGESDAFPASEFPAGRQYDRIVALSRSGTTTEVVEAVARVTGRMLTVAITADPETPIASLASATIVLDHAFERSVVQTRFATTALAVLRSSLGESLDAAVADGERAVHEPLPLEPGQASQITFLGLGWAAGIANEAALKCREAAGVWTESYPAMEYRHGPISVTGPGTAVWVLGPAPDGLAGDVAATGATLVTSDLDPMADLIRAQRLAIATGRAKGLDPDHPLNLSFSVTLDREPSR